MSNRKEYRQHSKSTLLRATQTLFTERSGIIAHEARRWRPRVAVAAVLGFVVGLLLGRLIG